MELIKRKYQLEIPPIRVVDKPTGGTTTQMGQISGRVVDNYTGMDIGSVHHGPLPNGQVDYTALCSFPVPSKDAELEPPDGTWKFRFDLEAYADWHEYNRQLPRSERVKRVLWRWMGVEWLLIGTVWGVVVSLMANAIVN